MPALIGRVSRKRGCAKMKLEFKRRLSEEKLGLLAGEDPDVRAELIQELIPLGIEAIAKELQAEVGRLAGARHARGHENLRWGRQNGSVYLRDQKVPIRVPRLRDRQNQEVRLESYERFQRPSAGSDQAVLKLLHGLSTHRYKESAELAPEVFGLSASGLSKRFKTKTAATLRHLQTRTLRIHDFVVVFIDGKRYADDGILTAIGVTSEGKKVVLGIEHTHSESSKAVEDWLDRLIARGFKFEEGVLFVIDGSRGIKKALLRKFREYALIQRCRNHKKENVSSYLDEAGRDLVKRRMNAAYAKTSAQDAKRELLKLHAELVTVNESAANSLLEGLDETLTAHELDLPEELRRSLGTTNCIESVMSQLGQYTDKVDRWRNSNQILRWSAACAIDLEPRLRRMRGFRHLATLRSRLKAVVLERQKLSANTVEVE